jgi:hypothetical protein
MSTLGVGAQRATVGIAQTGTLMASIGAGDDRADPVPDRLVARATDRAPDQRHNHDPGRARCWVMVTALAGRGFTTA